jgi:hypothetical protein
MKTGKIIPFDEMIKGKETMSKELKVCPFCGGKAEASEGGFGPVNEKPIFDFHDVMCVECLAIVHGSSASKAVFKWNTRSADTALVDFARKVIKINCWNYEPDGLTIQDQAEELGLIESFIATADDIDEESDFEVGDRIYQFAGILKEQV